MIRDNFIERIFADAGVAADTADFAGFTPLISAAFGVYAFIILTRPDTDRLLVD